jgi:hypothetical protein
VVVVVVGHLLVDIDVTVSVRCAEVDCDEFMPHDVVPVESTHVTSYTPSTTDEGRSNSTSLSESGLFTAIVTVLGAEGTTDKLPPPRSLISVLLPIESSISRL